MQAATVICFALMACFCTYEVVWRVCFRKHWERDQREYLREQFGESPLDEATVYAYWQASVPIWLVLSVLCWVLLAFALTAFNA